MSPQKRDRRSVNQLLRDTLAVVMAGGRGARLHQLTARRSKPAVPFGGKFRIIDFTLSNCINSGIRRMSVLTQYNAHSLIRHVERAWSFLRPEFGEFIKQGIDFVIHVRTQELAITTWLNEAFNRERGPGD